MSEISGRVYALIFNGISRASSGATDERDWMRLTERERFAQAVYDELRAGNIEFRLGGLALLADAIGQDAPQPLRPAVELSAEDVVELDRLLDEYRGSKALRDGVRGVLDRARGGA